MKKLLTSTLVCLTLSCSVSTLAHAIHQSSKETPSAEKVFTPPQPPQPPHPKPRPATPRVKWWNETPDNETLRGWMYEAGKKYNVKPEYVMAVGNIESRIGKKEFRCFEIGRKPYYGPMGLVVPILDPKENIDRGAKALARYGPVTNLEQLKRVLQKYNAEFNGSYWSEIKKAVDRYEFWVYLYEHGITITSLMSEVDTLH